MRINPDGSYPLVFMKPKVVQRFEYKGRKIKIIDHGKGSKTARYWYKLKSGFTRPGGNKINQAMREARRDIDIVREVFGVP